MLRKQPLTSANAQPRLLGIARFLPVARCKFTLAFPSLLLLIVLFSWFSLFAAEQPTETGRRVLATADFDLIGLAVTAEPAHQAVPKHTATGIATRLGLPGTSLPPDSQLELNPNYRVRGELTGPSLTAPLTLEAAVGSPLSIPPLSRAGDHVVQSLRLVDTGAPGAPVVAQVIPDSCTLTVVDQLLVSEVQVHELTYDEIVRSGLNIDRDSYSYYAFTLGLGTTSSGQKITIPVALPRLMGELPVVGTPDPPVGKGVPIPDVLPVLLKPDLGADSEAPDFELAEIRIPGLIVFPGRIGLLHQFFEAVVIVTNGAPQGTALIVSSLRAGIRLPERSNPVDNPLRIAELQVGGRVEELDLHGLGPDESYGTADDISRFAPGDSGHASFLIEGLKEGLHTVWFDLEGTVEGLPVGPVAVKGEVSGAVLVRDGRFAVTFTHPSVVRAGQEYQLSMTLFNSGDRDLLGVYSELLPGSISGADLLADSENPTSRRDFQTTIKPGEAATVAWGLRARVTGAVTASYVKVEGASVGLNLVTGIGDRNVPLSPESLILPDPVKYLPAEVVDASRNLLGQAWSIATAPSGSLPAEVLPVSKQTVLDRAIELGVAGLRVRFGEALHVSLVTLLRDWLGEEQQTADEGFSDTIRATPAGYAWFDSLGGRLSEVIASGVAVEVLHRSVSETEMARSRFVSAFVTHPEGVALAGIRFVGPDGCAVGLTTPSDRFGALPTGAMLRLNTDASGQTRSRGGILLVSKPDPGQWLLELYAWQSGSVNVSLLVPIDDDSYRVFRFTNVPLVAGGIYRISFDPYSASSVRLEQCNLGACTLWGPQALIQYFDEKPPAVVGVVQLSPAVLDSGDQYGRLAAVLFSKPMSSSTVEKSTSYRIGGGAPVGAVPPVPLGLIEVSDATLSLGSRFAVLGLSGPIGPFFSRTLSVSSVTDTRGVALNPPIEDRPVETTVSPEGLPPAGFLTGRVLNGDGTPVANAPVTLSVMPCELWREPLRLSRAYTDSAGRYSFEYVINGECSPVIVSAVHPVTGSNKELSTPVSYHGQHLVIDLIFLARGAVEGTVNLGGTPVNAAYVRVMPESDPAGGKLVRSDSLGRYLAPDVPVGRVSVFAVGSGSLSTSTGFAASWIDRPGQVAKADVSLQNVKGSISGRVEDPEGHGAANMLVVASAVLSGIDLPVYVGFCYSLPDGSFSLPELPVTQITIRVDDVAGNQVSQIVQLSTQTPEVSGVILTLPGFGAISGRVVDQAGRYIGGAEVRCGVTTTLADVFGYFSFPMVQAGNRTVRAVNPETGLAASVTVIVAPGQTTANVSLVISAAAMVKGTVFISQPGSAPVALVGARVSHDGYTVTTTDTQGAYTLRNIAPGEEYTLRFVDPTGRLALNQAVRLNPGETLIRNVTFHPAAIGGRVFQPDDQTGAVARVELWVPRPILKPGQFFGLLDLSDPITTITAGDGSYLIGSVNPAEFRITAYNDFFPTRVSRLGRLPADSLVACNLSLVDTLAGTIHGRVYQPDGTTAAGPGVWVTLGGGTLADARVQTDDAGDYTFPEVFTSGTYSVTAEDPKTGASNRVWVSAEKNEDSVADIRLLGRGSIQVEVVDAAGAPVDSGAVELSGVDFPNAQDRVELLASDAGRTLFDGVPEGPYAITASRQGLSGRVAVVVPNGGTVSVAVKLQSAGTVSGQVLMPDGSTPAELADVRLIVAGKTVGYCTSASDGTGDFSFPNVPLGDFKLEAFDNRSTRTGRTAGRVTEHGQLVTANITLFPVGTVKGQVTANGAAVDHALVAISAGESGFSYTQLKATTDSTGSYRFGGIPAGKFRLSATHPEAALTGSAEGSLDGISEPIPDKVVNIALESSASLAGFIYEHAGTPVGGAQITVRIGSRTFRAASREDGSYRVDYVPLGEATIRAEAPAGFDRGETGPVAIAQAGATVTANVTFDGTGTVEGAAFDSDGTTRLASGVVTLTNAVWTPAVVLSVPVVDGRYSLAGVPAGDFSANLTVAARVGAGSAASTLAAGQTLVLDLLLEPAGTVTGRVLKPDGISPAVGVDVTTNVTKTDSSKLTLVAHTDATGHFRHEQVPLGSISISVSDPDSDAVGLAIGLTLSANGQILDVPIVLDDQPITVVSVTPANGALNVPRSTTVVVTFSEPAKASTVTTGSFRLLRGAAQQPASVSLSPDGLVAILAPAQPLADEGLFTVSVGTQVTDRVGHPLASEFRSTFSTPDDTPAVVVSFEPAWDTNSVALDKVVQVTFNEPLDPQQSWTGVVRLYPEGQPTALVPLVISLDESGVVLTAGPSVPLVESTRYWIEVTGHKDLAGNIQTAIRSSFFSTVDQTKPVITSVSVEGRMLFTTTPQISVDYQDNFSGIDPTSLIWRLDGQDIKATAYLSEYGASYQVPASAPLARGSHTVEAQVSDKVGNQSDLKTASFTIDDVPPQITSFTIAGQPAVDGMAVTIFRPSFVTTYSDNGGVDVAATRLRLGLEGLPLVEAPATVGPTKLTYLPAVDLAQGLYLVELVVTDYLGNSTTAGPIRLLVDVDAPEITTLAPLAGNQHGGTTLVLTGSRLLHSNGDKPRVWIGGNEAWVTAATPGTPDQVIIVTPPGAPGFASIQITTDRGTGALPAAFLYETDPQTPFAVEPDTVLLWHLDEPEEFSWSVKDSGPFETSPDAYYRSVVVPARFGLGRSGAMSGYNQSGVLDFGASSFTIDCWLKSGPVTKTYLLAGKQLDTTGYGISLLPSGSLQGWLQDEAGLQWVVETPAELSIVDEQWHSVSLVVDRETHSLSVFVDAVQSAAVAEPTGFGTVGDEVSGDYYYSEIAFGAADHRDHTNPGDWQFPGVIDEVRFSSTAHSADQIQQVFLGLQGPLPLSVFRVRPEVVTRGSNPEIILDGYELSHVQAEVIDSSGLVHPAELKSSSATEARVQVLIPSSAALGMANLRILPPSGEAVVHPVRILDKEESLLRRESDTLLLWHLDEPGDGAVTIADSGRLAFDGVGASSSRSLEGLFGKARHGTVYGPKSKNFDFSTSSFTVEGWAKDSYIRQPGLWFGEDYLGLAGYVYDTTGAEWKVVIPPHRYDESSGEWTKATAKDGQWHFIALVVDRTVGMMRVYLDGREVGSADAPPGFGALRYSPDSQISASGDWDELRISSGAHTSEKIWEDFTGEHAVEVTAVSPQSLQRVPGSPFTQDLVLDGFQLGEITCRLLQANQPSASITVNERSYGRVSLSVTVNPEIQVGPAQLVISSPNVPDVSVDILIMEQSPFPLYDDTLLLWRLDETASGMTAIADSGPFQLNGQSGYASLAAGGRFQGAREMAGIAGPSETRTQFNTSSFSIDFWLKTGAVLSSYPLLRRSSYNSFYSDFVISILPSGVLQAQITATSGVSWQVATQLARYDEQAGWLFGIVDDGRWHSVSVVVDRPAHLLSLYVDGLLRATAQSPAGFGSVGGPYSGAIAASPATSTTCWPPTCSSFFPGALDDIRISSEAHSPEQVWSEYSGIW